MVASYKSVEEEGSAIKADEILRTASPMIGPAAPTLSGANKTVDVSTVSAKGDDHDDGVPALSVSVTAARLVSPSLFQQPN